jgi:hypothetical protein
MTNVTIQAYDEEMPFPNSHVAKAAKCHIWQLSRKINFSSFQYKHISSTNNDMKTTLGSFYVIRCKTRQMRQIRQRLIMRPLYLEPIYFSFYVCSGMLFEPCKGNATTIF